MSIDVSPVQGPHRGRNDRWSWLALASSGSLCLFMLSAEFLSQFSERATLLVVLGIPIVILLGACSLAYGSIATLVFLIKRRWRAAASHVLGIALLVLSVLSIPVVGAASDELRFRYYLPQYEKLIAEWRTNNPTIQPIRLALEQRDLSLFVTSTHFQTIVYDEGDAVLKDPCPAEGYGSCPRSVERIRGHFYRVDGF